VEGALRGAAPAGLRLIETFRWEPERGFPRLLDHLRRLARSCKALGIELDGGELAQALEGISGDAPLRVRLTVGLAGDVAVETAPLGAARAEWVVSVAETWVFSGDPWLAVKTTRRPVHDAARAALTPGVDEAVLLNERGEVAEGTITSVFVEREGGVVVTPPLSSGVLPGVLRAELLKGGRCREEVLWPSDLAGGFWVGNSLRGLIRARLA
jgi:4-amino-4-deoxychorismate lyase